MRVLAIDPGYDRLGIAVMEHENGKEKLLHSECLLTKRDEALTERLLVIGKAVDALLAHYTPDAVAIETLFFNTNQTTGIAVAEVRGIIIYLARLRGANVFEYGPQKIKVAVTGYGKSDKKAMTDMVKRLIKDAPKDALDDEYDAIAVGITALAENRA